VVTNQEATNLAEQYTNNYRSELGNDLILVMLFGSTIEGKTHPEDVDIFVCTKSGKKPNNNSKKIGVACYSLDQIKDLVQGRGQGNPGFVRRRFLGQARVLYDAEGYYKKINNAFASGNPGYIN